MFLLKRLVPSVTLATAMLVTPAVAQEAGGNDEDVIVVRGTLIPDEKKATSEISSLLDAEDFARVGDTDIAAALRRVTGLSVQGGRFVIVRGLNERYSSATLNGLPIPSPEPLRRAAPLDLFPTSVIASTLVQKTFSPQYSGEFGGGLVELRSKAIPEEGFAEIGFGFSVNDETSMRNGLFYEGSNTDIFGYDEGLRDLPADASLLFQSTSPTGEEQNRADISFEQSKTLLITQDEVPANGSASVALGKRFYSEGEMTLGTVFYLGYDNDWQSRDGERFRLQGVNSKATDFFLTRQDVAISALSSTGLEFNQDHMVQLTGLIVRKSLKQSEIANETFTGDDREFLVEKTDYIERQLWQGQLIGEHYFPDLADLTVAWKFAYGEAERDQPYKRQTGFIRSTGSDDFLFTVEEGLSNIDFRFLKDENLAGGVDLVLPLESFDMPIELSFGAAYSETDRTTSQRLFEFRGTFPQDILRSRADLIFSDEIMGLDGPQLQFRSSRGEPDNFEGNLEVLGVYGAADVELGPFVRAALGVRYEDSTQQTATFLTRDPEDKTAFAPIEEEYFLPAITLTWNPIGNFQIRGGFSQTITRPQFRELSPSVFTDPDTDVTYVGNPFLQNTEIDNYDIRAEWYFARGEFATLGVFFKEMTNPIEEAIVTQGEAVRTTFLNAPSAELFGAEFEFEKNFSFESIFGDNDFTYGKDFVFKTNYTYTDGTVSNDGTVIVPNISGQGVTPSERPAEANVKDGSRLVGLSEHLFNLQFGIETENGAKVTLAANYASERTLIRGEATSGGLFLPATVEQPPITLDFIIDQPFTLAGGNYNLSVRIQNLLDDDFEAFYEDDGTSILSGEPIFQQYDLGRSLSVGIKRKF